jgi:hypothetical protein
MKSRNERGINHEIAMRNKFGSIANAAPPSITHRNREQALKRARLTAGFPNIVNGRRIDSSRTMKISDPGGRTPRNQRTSLRTVKSGCQTGNAGNYPAFEDQVAKDKQESLQDSIAVTDSNGTRDTTNFRNLANFRNTKVY